MCGISGIISIDNISNKLYSSIKNLEYRGYDSCGIAVIEKGEIIVKKNTGSVEEVNDKENLVNINSTIGIAHTRWATHGGVTKLNTHPHLSCDKKIAIAHNGIISNYRKLRDLLKGDGHIFKSETDTEVIVHLIEKYFKEYNDTEKAMIKAIKDIEGTFALLIVNIEEPDKILCAKKESPLILGIGDECMYVGSDYNAFIEYTKNAIILDDGEYAVIARNGYVIKNFITDNDIDKEIIRIEWDAEMAKKGGYPHYMLKEIYEQPQAISNALDIDNKLVKDIAKCLNKCRSPYLLGVGTTYYVASYSNYFFSKYSGAYIPALSSDEFNNLAEVDEDSFILAISQSGETYDTLNSLKAARECGAATAAVVNVIGSSMARLVDQVIIQGSGPEICVLSTKAAISQMIIMSRIGLELGVLRKKITESEKAELIDHLRGLPEIVQDFLNEQSGFIHNLARNNSHKKNWLYLGRGIYYPIALEAALKMKEVAYVHAEGMPGGFLKHGTIAMIDEDLSSIVFLPPEEEGELFSLTLSSVEEIRARDGFVIGVCCKDNGRHHYEHVFNEKIVVPKHNKITTPFLQLIAAQLLSYFTATTLKRNVDKPRSLAKSVTVA